MPWGRRFRPKCAAQRQVAATFFGEGAASIGALHEAMNLASIWKLPVVFVCENNGYCAVDAGRVRGGGSANIAEHAAAYDMPGRDGGRAGRDRCLGSRPAAVARARAGDGPSLIECRPIATTAITRATTRAATAPWRRKTRRAGGIASSGSARRRVKRGGPSTREELDAIDAGNREKLDARRELRRGQPAAGSRGAVSPTSRAGGDDGGNDAGSHADEPAVRELTFSQAINEAMRLEMRRDPNVIVVWARTSPAARAGRTWASWMPGAGRCAATKGLITEFGPQRVLDTPISEMGFVGAAVGAAMAGLRPIVEIMFVDLDRLLLRPDPQSGRQDALHDGRAVELPLVIRTAYGTRGGGKRTYGGGAAAQHSQTLYSILAHIPGAEGGGSFHGL